MMIVAATVWLPYLYNDDSKALDREIGRYSTLATAMPTAPDGDILVVGRGRAIARGHHADLALRHRLTARSPKARRPEIGPTVHRRVGVASPSQPSAVQAR
jgi:hypothetical protein